MSAKKSYITCTDQFCGAGGSSIGAIKAGVEIRLALNHSKLAVETYSTNNPLTDIDCTDISAVDPRRYPSTDILITSPECTNHSLSKGKKRTYYEKDLFGTVLIDPLEERSRATMWDVPRFAEFHDYNVVIVENVVDAGKWRLFDAWLGAMHALDYEHEVVYFNSMFAWPTPQSRDRMYTIFWKRGNKRPDLDFRPAAWCQNCQTNTNAIQTWKKGKWGRYKAQYFYRCPICHKQVEPYYYCGLNAIDFSIPSVRIGDRPVPLKPKTMARVKYGFETYGRTPMIVTGRYTTGVSSRVRDAMFDVVPTQPGDASHAVVMPWMVETSYGDETNRARGLSEPMYTQTGTGKQAVVMPWLIETSHNGDNRAQGVDSPLMTQTARQSAGVVMPFFVKTSRGDAAYSFSVDGTEPMQTQTTCQDVGVAYPGFMVDMHGKSTAHSLNDPLMCVSTSGSHHALLSADSFLTYYYGQSKRPGDMLDPIYTMTGNDRAGLVSNVASALESMTVDDLTFRMLQAKEIGKAMAFPSTYVVKGNQRQQVKQYGNAVTPPAMGMLMDRCMATFE